MDFSVFLYRDDILWITAFTLGGLSFALGPIVIVHLFMPRKTRQIVWQNIGLAFVVKLLFIGLGILGLTSMGWAVFADVGVTILAVLNATRVLRV